MDKLKQNLFPISVGAVGVVLLVLAYVLVFKKFQELAGVSAKVSQETSRLKTLVRKNPLPVKEIEEQLEREIQSKKSALEEGIQFYEQRTRAFRTYFNNEAQPQALSTFVSEYNDGVTKLIEGYRSKFDIKVEEGAADARPTVDRVDVTDESRIERAMKEYWIIQEVFRAFESLGLKGLKSIAFPARDVQPKEPPPYWRTIAFTVEAQVPFSKLEDLLTQLYASPMVSLILEELTLKKTPELIIPYLPLEKEVSFQDAVAASRQPYEALVPEPDAVVTLRFTAIDWKGVPETQVASPGSAKTE